MACIIAPATEAIVVKVVEKCIEKKESQEVESGEVKEIVPSIPLGRKLKWLTYMLWGGVFILAFEHIWHGEIVPWFPFLTAMSDPEDTAQMLHEIATVGVSMAVLITAVWVGMCKVADVILKRPATDNVNNTIG